MPCSNPGRLLNGGALDDVEAAHLFLGFGERAIGYQSFAVTNANGDGIAAWPEPSATTPYPAAVHLGGPVSDPGQGMHLVRAQDQRLVIADHQHVLHASPSVATTSS